MKFQKLNLNPKNHGAADCVVRALAEAFNMSWYGVYDHLCLIGRELGRMPNEDQCYEKFLQEKGWKKNKAIKVNGNHRITVEQFIDEHMPSKSAVVRVSRHLTFVDGDTLVDLWDCRKYSAGNYWIKG